MDSNRFTVKAQNAIQNAGDIAASYGNQSLENCHLLGALMRDKAGIVRRLCEKCGAETDMILIRTGELMERLPKVSGASVGSKYISESLARTFDSADRIARGMKDEFIALEHLIVSLAENKDETAKLLNSQGVNRESLLRALKDIRGNSRVSGKNAEENYNALKKYGIDLNEAAKAGKLDPVIGREDEIRRVMQVLARRTKNNPVLVGEPGVGKTAIVEGIAHRIISGDVPESLADKKVITLDLGSLIAGTSFRGQFEERLKALIKEVTDSAGGIILFIDEIHMLIGAGSVSGSMDAANILKPALARGDLRCIGATTLDEYAKYIESDGALERRFRKITVSEPSVQDTISVLRGLKERYEIHHGIRISDSALVAAAELSARYITGRFLPDKAIDIIDEACGKLRMESDSVPEELDSIERQIRRLEIEKSAILKEIGSRY